MSFSIKKLLGLKSDRHASFVLHDQYLEVAELYKKDEMIELKGLNRIALEEGIVEGGEIKSESRFQDSLEKLLLEAAPESIQTKKLYVSIPYLQIYPFVKTFPKHSKEKNMMRGMEQMIQSEAPFPLEDLQIEYSKNEGKKSINYGAVAYPKIWQKMVLEAFREVGISDLHFFPEPLAQLGLSRGYIKGNFVLFSWDSERVHLSVFYDDLLYDSFEMKTHCTEANPNIDALMSEYSEAKKHFEDKFKASIQEYYLVGFPQNVQSGLSNRLSKEKFEYCTLASEDTDLKDVIRDAGYSPTLYGAAMRALHHNK